MSTSRLKDEVVNQTSNAKLNLSNVTLCIFSTLQPKRPYKTLGFEALKYRFEPTTTFSWSILQFHGALFQAGTIIHQRNIPDAPKDTNTSANKIFCRWSAHCRRSSHSITRHSVVRTDLVIRDRKGEARVKSAQRASRFSVAAAAAAAVVLIRLGCWDVLYYIYNKQCNPQNSAGNYVNPSSMFSIL